MSRYTFQFVLTSAIAVAAMASAAVAQTEPHIAIHHGDSANCSLETAQKLQKELKFRHDSKIVIRDQLIPGGRGWLVYLVDTSNGCVIEIRDKRSDDAIKVAATSTKTSLEIASAAERLAVWLESLEPRPSEQLVESKTKHLANHVGDMRVNRAESWTLDYLREGDFVITDETAVAISRWGVFVESGIERNFRNDATLQVIRPGLSFDISDSFGVRVSAGLPMNEATWGTSRSSYRYSGWDVGASAIWQYQFDWITAFLGGGGYRFSPTVIQSGTSQSIVFDPSEGQVGRRSQQVGERRLELEGELDRWSGIARLGIRRRLVRQLVVSGYLTGSAGFTERSLQPAADAQLNSDQSLGRYSIGGYIGLSLRL